MLVVFLIIFFCFSGGWGFWHLLCPPATPKENAARLFRYSATHDGPAGDLQAFGRDEEEDDAEDDAEDEEDADDEEKEVESRATTTKKK